MENTYHVWTGVLHAWCAKLLLRKFRQASRQQNQMHLLLGGNKVNWKRTAVTMNALPFAQATAQEQLKSATTAAQRELSEAQSDAAEARSAAHRRLTATQVQHS